MLPARLECRQYVQAEWTGTPLSTASQTHTARASGNSDRVSGLPPCLDLVFGPQPLALHSNCRTTLAGMSRRYIPVVLLTFALALAGCGEGESTTSSSTTTASEPAEPAEPVTFAVGETADAGDWSVTLNGVTDPWVDPDMGGGEAGTRFLVADVSLENSSAASSTTSGGCFDLRDTDGRSHSWTLVGENDSPDGEVAPGEQLRGDVGFQIPEDVVASTLLFTCGTQPARFTISDEAGAAPASTTTPPASEAPPESVEAPPSVEPPASEGSDVEPRLIEAADQIGCATPTIEDGTGAVGLEQYAVCDLAGSRVQLYAVGDRPAFEKAVEGYGADLAATSVWKGDDVMFTPDDQSQLDQIRAAIG